MADRAEYTELFKHMNEKNIESSLAFFRSGLLINGGAAVAVLGFVASVAKADQSFTTIVVGVADALMLFAWGILCSIAGIAIVYLTGLTAIMSLGEDYGTRSVKILNRLNAIGHFVGIAIATSMAIFFILGAAAVKDAIVEGFPTANVEDRGGSKNIQVAK